jgi:PST family polysaccharide transporter
MKLSKYLRHGLTQNILALYGVHFVNYLLPIITVPYVARVLEPTNWGLVAFAQAFGQYVTLLVEYGFNISATREVSRYRDAPDKLADLVAGVLGAKGLLALFALVLTLIVQHLVSVFQNYPALLWASLFTAMASAFSPLWYYQGLERMQLVAALNILTKVLFTAGIFFLVHSQEDGWKVLALPGVASLLSTAVALGLVYSEVPFCFPVRALVWDALRIGWTMFLYRGGISLYAVGNTFILGLFAPPQLVGYYAGAEKISKAFVGLLGPMSQALYPRLSHLVYSSRDKAKHLARVGIGVIGMGGALMGVVAFLLAPFLVRILLGQGFEPAIPVLRVLALLPPLIALSNVLGIQWMLPLSLDRPFNAIILGAGLINLGLAVFLAPRHAQLGMTYTVLLSEIFVVLATYVFLSVKKLGFWNIGQLGKYDR